MLRTSSVLSVMEDAASRLCTFRKNDVCFAFSDICVAVPQSGGLDKCMGKESKPDKVLLAGIQGVVRSGRVFAIMGPSGAGKTTLLEVLMQTYAGPPPSGKCTLNGTPFTSAVRKDHCSVVGCHPDMIAWLTCRQHLNMAVSLYQASLSKPELEEAIDALLTSTGLKSCENTIVGNASHPGLSSGQQKRLSLALGLAKKPSAC